MIIFQLSVDLDVNAVIFNRCLQVSTLSRAHNDECLVLFCAEFLERMFDIYRCKSAFARLLGHDGGDLAFVEQLPRENSWSCDCDSVAELAVDNALIHEDLLAFRCLDLFHATPNKR